MWKKLPVLALLLPALSCTLLPSQEQVEARKREQPASLTVVDGKRLLAAKETGALLGQRLSALPEPAAMRELLSHEEAITGNPLVMRNRIHLLIDGEQTYAAMFERIRQARDHVHLQTYIFTDEEIGQKLAELLKQKAAEGVEVRVLYDAIGGLFVPESFYQELNDAGVQARKFNPVDPLEDPRLWRLNHREHSKLLIIDGQFAFTGGLNISAVYEERSGLSRSLPAAAELAGQGSWRDTHVEVSGPIVTYLQQRFAESWTELGDEDLSKDLRYFPVPDVRPNPGALLRLLTSDGADTQAEIYELYLAAIDAAQTRLWITQAYFAPDKAVLAAIRAAARRGVDVRIILPGVLDQGLVYHSSRARYGELLEAGVRLYEFEDRVLHAKTIVIDGLWATVGSANFDFRSFIHNNELNLSVVDAEFARALEQQFETDRADSRAIELEAWRARPLLDKFKEQGARMLDYWL